MKRVEKVTVIQWAKEMRVKDRTIWEATGNWTVLIKESSNWTN